MFYKINSGNFCIKKYPIISIHTENKLRYVYELVSMQAMVYQATFKSLDVHY